MLLYSIVFILLMYFAFLDINLKNNKTIQRIIVYFFSIVFIFLSTIYCGEKGDYETYNYWFMELSFDKYDTWIWWHFEPLYTLLNVIAKEIYNEYWFLRMVLIIMVTTFWNQIYLREEVCNNCEKNYPCVLLFICWALQFGNIFLIRSTVSVTFCLFSLRYIREKDIIKFIVATLCAIGFHYMAILWLLAYPLYYLNMRRRVWYFLLVLSYMLSDSILSNVLLDLSKYLPISIKYRIQYYINTGKMVTFNDVYSYHEQLFKASLSIISVIIIFELILCFSGNVKNSVNRYFNIYMFGAVIYASSFSLSLAMGRAAMPFTMIQILVLPEIFNMKWINSNIHNRLIVFLVFSLYLAMRMYVQTRNGYIPFTNMLEW